MKMFSRSSMIATLAAAGSLASATSFTLYGLLSATVNGVTYTPSSGPIPQGLTYNTFGNAGVALGASASAAVDASGAGVRKKGIKAKGTVQFGVMVARPAGTPASAYLYVGSSLATSVSADASVHHPKGGASGTGTTAFVGSVTATATAANRSDEKQKSLQNPLSVFVQIAPPNSPGSGNYTATFLWNTPLLTGSATARCIGTGSYDAAGGDGGASAAYQPQTAFWSKGQFGGGKQAFVTTLFFSFYDNTNSDVWDVGLQSEGADADLPLVGLPAGTYTVYVSAQGSLRKRMILNYDGVNGVEGLDFTLYWGDLDGDGTVSQAEVDYVASVVGAKATDGEDSWMGESSDGPFAPYMADLDGDGAVTQADLDLANAGLGHTSDQP